MFRRAIWIFSIRYSFPINLLQMTTLSTTRYSIPLDSKGIKEQIRSKYKTLTSWKGSNEKGFPKRRSFNWDGQQIAKPSRGASRNSRLSKQEDKLKNSSAPPKEEYATLNLQTLRGGRKRNRSLMQQGAEVKLMRRDRLRYSRTPLQIVKHYARNQPFDPTPQQLKIIQTFMQKHPIMLQLLKNDELLPCLEISYELLNMAVDFNSMKFLCLLIDFIGNICLYAQDFGRSTFFFEQLRLACSYSKNYKLKVDALIGLAKNATSLKMYKESHIILKKALQYAWAVANEDKELLIYDMMGISYYYMGQLKKAEYFHSRFVLGKLELSSSATKSISFEILNDYHQHLQVVETENLTTLFLQFLTLPIQNTEQVPNLADKTYNNYSATGDSPRKNKDLNYFQQLDFDGQKLITRLLEQDKQFTSQIPNPTLRDVSLPPTSNEVPFERTPYYVKKFKRMPEYDHDRTNTKIYKYPLENIITTRLKRSVDPDWWEKMVERLTHQKMDIHGKVRDAIVNKQLAFRELKAGKVRTARANYFIEQYNTVLLDFIDPEEGS